MALPDTATVNRDQTNATVDDSDLTLAATAIVDQAISSGALTDEPGTLSTQPAAAMMSAVYATLQQARTATPPSIRSTRGRSWGRCRTTSPIRST